MDFNEEWEYSANVASKRDSLKKNRNLRYCPGIYRGDGSYHDVWLKCWLETTPYSTFEELWDSGMVKFIYERYENADEGTKRGL